LRTKVEGLKREGMTLAQARREVAALRDKVRQVQEPIEAERDKALLALETDYQPLLQKLSTTKDTFETTAQYQARLDKEKKKRETVERKYQTDRAAMQRNYAEEINWLTRADQDRIAELVAGKYPVEDMKVTLMQYNADTSILDAKVNEV
jgi:hypothetical protein